MHGLVKIKPIKMGKKYEKSSLVFIIFLFNDLLFSFFAVFMVIYVWFCHVEVNTWGASAIKLHKNNRL